MISTLANTGRRGTNRAGLAAAVSRYLWFLDGDRLCAEARRRTGLEDFGDPPVERVLSVLTESLEREAELHALGRFLMRIHLRDLLETRLRLAQAWRENRERLELQRIERPIFITGMPRSGSTFLHELMAENPEHRAPRVWEVMFPVGSGKAGKREQARRIRKAETCLWWFRRLAPRADAVYPMRAHTPHECVAIHSYTFLSQEFISTCQIPTYEAFLEHSDLTPAYAWQRRFLQHLQSDGPGRRWLLKSPDHAHGLRELFSIFPDALVIQTHRNPVEALKSSTDLTRVLRGLYGAPGDPEEVRMREARVLAEDTERFIEFRDAHPELAHRFIDVKYTELVAEPLATVRRIYQELEIPLTNVMTRRVQELAINRSRYRGRRASAEAIDVRPAMRLEHQKFERYCARFQLSLPEPKR